MNTLFICLFESTLCVSALYAVYWVFLRRETFFSVNRFYLLAMVLFSMLFPLLPMHRALSTPPASLVVLLEPVMITPAKVELTLQNHLQWIEIAAGIYFSGVLYFLLRFVLRLIQLHRIVRRSGISEHHGHRVVYVDRGYSPFSFLNLTFINPALLPDDTLPTILEHERVHIRQHHTADMVLLELATLLQWFNPVMWLASREMKSIHEYLADEGVLQNGISRPGYQQMILDETMGIRVNNLTNNFNVSLLKKRIAMMTKSKSKTWAKSKVLISLPALLALMFMLTAGSYSNPEVLNVSSGPVFNPIHLIPAPSPVVQDKPNTGSQVSFTDPKTGKPVYKVVKKMPSYPGGDDARLKFLAGNIKYPEAAIKNNIQGTVYLTFTVRDDGSVTDVKVLRGIGGGCDEEALRVVKLMPKWNPGEEKGKPVDVIFNLPIKFALDGTKKEEPKK